jgi:D-glycerate 3-kinase
MCAERGLRAVTLSIDDFYLTRDEQLRLAAAYPGNRTLEHRGYPGTHDIALGAATLDALAKLGAGRTLKVPAYDKSAHGGRGDRAPESRWPVVRGPFDAVILEGWMLGFEALDASAMSDPHLAVANELLRGYAAWHARLSAWLVLRMPDLPTIVRWRVDSEAARAAKGEACLSPEQALDYIQRFLPAYALYVDPLIRRVEVSERGKVVTLRGDRQANEETPGVAAP